MPPAPTQRQSVPRRVLLALLLGALAGAPASAAAAPTLQQAQGRVELLSLDGWRAQGAPAEIGTRLRTGTGRALVRQGAQGQVLMGSASELRRYRDEPDLLSGRFYLRGPVAVHVLGLHVVMDGAGQARVDLSAAEKRVAVMAGRVRIALKGQAVTVSAGQQIAVGSGVVTPFREADAWYAAQFQGIGEATVEATRGLVTLRPAQTQAARVAVAGDDLQPGAALNTGADAWAEIGFTGGGYLRLNAQSELSVVSIERTSLGREVQLRLVRGTAWNVVERGQGGYRLDTPVVSTAVRGTVFRVDAGGLVKVFDGQVALPGRSGQNLAQGQQRRAEGPVAALQTDAVDRFNIAQDAARAQRLTLDLELPGRSLQDLALAVRSLADARVTVTVAGQTVALGGDNGVFRLERLEQTLPEGEYTVSVRAERYGQTLQRRQTVTVDRTPPRVEGLTVRRVGRVLTLSGAVVDAASTRVQLSVDVGGSTYTRWADPRTGGQFSWSVPLPDARAGATLGLRDEADNRSYVQLP